MRAVIQRAESASVESSGEGHPFHRPRHCGFVGGHGRGYPEGCRPAGQKDCPDADFYRRCRKNEPVSGAGRGKRSGSEQLHPGRGLAKRPPVPVLSAPPGRNRPSLCMNTSLSSWVSMRSKVSKPGEFGADMKLHLVNDGPVTLMMDSRVEGV